jgi:hypothetical protein
LLNASLSVHLDGQPERLPVYRAAVAAGELPEGYAADDGAALLFRGHDLHECVASRSGARVIHVISDEAGSVREEPMSVRLLPGAQSATYGGSSEEVAELRALRAGRHRWD